MENEFLQTGLEAIKQASKIILKYYQNLESSDIEMKKDDTPVTIADKKAEEIIRSVISKAYPDHSFIGEEKPNVNNSSEFTWVIDPIDGTRYFTKGWPYFTTELALLKGSEVIVGISFNHIMKETLTAIKGQGSFLNGNIKLIVGTVSNLKDAYISTGSLKYFQDVDRVNQLITLNKNIAQLRSFEESRGFRLLCQSKLDGMVMALGKSWDFAGISLIIEEAGGVITTFSGDAIDFNSVTSQTMIAANPKLHPKILKYFLNTDKTTT